jgi:hypothetical protein
VIREGVLGRVCRKGQGSGRRKEEAAETFES